ncbi:MULTISPECIES: DUF885 domain-containing protein [unclassified Arsukibacterium]|uniref:DUF885 domain-containing protein n=1 Tax=unclassified Arsukibacterium TaxID=2635278 RepID=UPI000C58A1E3|nr:MULTISPECIES: DUF885 domain-containing protein [unclassified Arsukibacterium]MAA93878.1 DUF885 domain-containing protein [Rheinheimera sp.]MBM33329.1 DUF885 domain-containing protein [Rheinheimera sp.]HAW94120.1 DUF885 domain-containing protein [Candidatus Azambacteria bacterium]|tara:strand:- start:69992 stop:71869 length:1878 start_codon:yes stop_codon:yes gene_type:complete
MRKSLLCIAVAGILAGCSPAPENSTNNSAENPVTAQATVAASSTTERLNQWFEEKYEQQLQQSPLQMTFLGRKDKYDQIDDVTIAAEEQQLAWLAASVAELKANFNYDELDLEAQTSYDVWVYQYEMAKAGAAFRTNNFVFTQMQGIHALLPQILINFHKVDSAEDMQAYVTRIEGISKAITDLLQRAKQNAEQGVRPPRFAYEGVMQQLDNLLAGAPLTDSEQDIPLWADTKAKISSLIAADKISDEQAEQLRNDARMALEQYFQPAYSGLKQWLQDDIDNTDSVATGVGKQANGEAYYNHQLKVSTTTDLTAQEIHQIGLNEVERLTAEMTAIKNKVGFPGDLQEFFKFIKKDDQFYYPDTDAGRQGYIDDSQQYLDFINSRLPEFFGTLPKAGLIVKRVEPFREQPGAAQHYFPGTPDGSRPGVYYAHLSDMRSMPKNEMEAIAYHEGSPGHHMQISIAQELTSVPTFRTQAGFTAYVEGWALYSELLAKEMGAYQNPYSDFGRLITEMWRAVRLVVDTGLHSKSWTEQQAIDYFREKTPIAEGAVVSEVRRYIVMPGQATAYKIGMIKIRELRHYAEQELGERFDIREFHDTILTGGALPLSVLERRVKNWVNEVKSSETR